MTKLAMPIEMPNNKTAKLGIFSVANSLISTSVRFETIVINFEAADLKICQVPIGILNNFKNRELVFW